MRSVLSVSCIVLLFSGLFLSSVEPAHANRRGAKQASTQKVRDAKNSPWMTVRLRKSIGRGKKVAVRYKDGDLQIRNGRDVTTLSFVKLMQASVRVGNHDVTIRANKGEFRPENVTVEVPSLKLSATLSSKDGAGRWSVHSNRRTVLPYRTGAIRAVGSYIPLVRRLTLFPKSPARRVLAGMRGLSRAQRKALTKQIPRARKNNGIGSASVDGVVITDSFVDSKNVSVTESRTLDTTGTVEYRLKTSGLFERAVRAEVSLEDGGATPDAADESTTAESAE